jgi:two-component system alkaline phosphatase synthesis response regulator PhoP
LLYIAAVLLQQKLDMENSQIKILLVDDEPDILEFMEYNLKKEGFVIELAKNGREAISVANRFLPHLIILDIMMPDMDGIETCTELRLLPQFKNTIIAFLTARNEDYSQIAGFDVGADDFIAKPIKPRVLISRIKGLLRRFTDQNGGEAITNTTVGDIIIDREKYVVHSKGVVLDLPKKEFELISLLVSKPGKVFTREEILNSIWGDDVVVGDRTIDVHIRKLREKLGEECIKTVKGIGYKFDI